MAADVLYTPVDLLGVVAELDLPGQANRVLWMLMEQQEAGGRCVFQQAKLAEKLKISRSSAIVALAALNAARLVYRPDGGYKSYQFNPMISGYRTPADAWDAIEAMDPDDRLDDDHFITNYKKRLATRDARGARRRRTLLTIAG
ncbi:helix-turn-helix domain-containing protein [Kitasatospora phosalacinea]|uniref:helix-turn-helix domain-containing protein n=1 Tax=Kitasatospora phosalacinea TaxID=2065 RepID=UPI00068D9065|nr:helix-turn-helix domain-containing protein [Kitasatospora phosalacinea]